MHPIRCLVERGVKGTVSFRRMPQFALWPCYFFACFFDEYVENKFLKGGLLKHWFFIILYPFNQTLVDLLTESVGSEYFDKPSKP